MKVLILKDEKLLEDVYLLYIWALAYWELELRERLELLERLERLELRERLERLERLELREQRLELLELLELRELLERLERLELLERRELLELLERRELRELLERREWREWRELYVKNMRRLSQRLKNQDPELMQKLKKADELFKEVRLLQEKMPNCKIIY